MPAAWVLSVKALGIVVGNDVLAKFRADRFENVAKMTDHREVSEDGVLLLKDVVERDGQHQKDDDREDDEEGMHTIIRARVTLGIGWAGVKRR